MKKRYFILLIIVLLFSNLISAFAADTSEILPVQSIKLVVQPVYESSGTNLINVTYTAYTKGIPDGSIIDFYSGNPKFPYPTDFLGIGYVKEGKAFIKVFQKPETYFIGSAIYTLPIDSWPPKRVYSNIVSYYVPLCSASIKLGVEIDNSCKSNVTYTAKFSDFSTSQSLDTEADISKPSSIKVRFLTYEIPKDVVAIDTKSLIDTSSPLREDYAVITDWAAQVKINLKPGSYIVYADCSDITTSSDLKKFNVPKCFISQLPQKIALPEI